MYIELYHYRYLYIRLLTAIARSVGPVSLISGRHCEQQLGNRQFEQDLDIAHQTLAVANQWRATGPGSLMKWSMILGSTNKLRAG